MWLTLSFSDCQRLVHHWNVYGSTHRFITWQLHHLTALSRHWRGKFLKWHTLDVTSPHCMYSSSHFLMFTFNLIHIHSFYTVHLFSNLLRSHIIWKRKKKKAIVIVPASSIRFAFWIFLSCPSGIVFRPSPHYSFLGCVNKIMMI